MPVSGSVAPRFNIGTVNHATTVVASVSTGTATVAIGTESLPQFLRRAAGVLAVSGTLTSGMQGLSLAALSGVHNLQQELVLRAADIELGGKYTVTDKLAHANAILTASGEVQWGE